MIIPIIMAGGTGSRLWPLSRDLYPKQFLNISGEHTMLQKTLQRLEGIRHDDPIIICNEEHRFIVAEQVRTAKVNVSDIILEPVGRNTAPAITIAALKALESDPESIILVLAADHIIENEDEFCSVINKSTEYAKKGKLVTFGINPTAAETGFGYIKKGANLSLDPKGIAFEISAFIEKPSKKLAEQYLKSQDYYWNSGIFLFKASVFLDELKKFSPKIIDFCHSALSLSKRDLDFLRLDEKEFSNCPSISIDYALMEKTSLSTVVPMDVGWDDIGSWFALWKISTKDGNNNAVTGDVVTLDTYNSYIRSESKLVATLNVDNLVIVETKDAILVANKNKVQNVKGVVNWLRDNERSEAKTHRVVYRPWGKYDSIDRGKRDDVKRITVNPREKLSMQVHRHRAEHWVVVSGIAKVTLGDKTILVSEGESTYIPIGTVHALENPGDIPLEMIEVRTGNYISEEDIIRVKYRDDDIKR